MLTRLAADDNSGLSVETGKATLTGAGAYKVGNNTIIDAWLAAPHGKNNYSTATPQDCALTYI